MFMRGVLVRDQFFWSEATKTLVWDLDMGFSNVDRLMEGERSKFMGILNIIGNFI